MRRRWRPRHGLGAAGRRAGGSDGSAAARLELSAGAGGEEHLLHRPRREPSPQIKVATRRDVGILEKPVDVSLTPATTVRWMWNVARLPSQIAEDVTAGHDYLSIAVRFDNDQDLTYMFSSTLPVGTGFRCPLRNWKDRETHVILHSGSGDLGRWLTEERTILPDYLKYVGGAAPKRITQVWLIANSSIQKTEGDASFAKISLGERRGRLQVL